MTVTRNLVCWVLAMLVLTLGGCLKKASYFPDRQGGFRLVTTANNLEQALIRLRRTADDLCPGYEMSDPKIIDYGVGGGPLWNATTTTVEAHLTCPR